MERAFNFKLFVPPRANSCQISAVKPQDSGLFEDSINLMQIQGYKSFDKEASLPFSNTNMVAPTKFARAEIAKKTAVMPMEKEETSRSSQLFSKLFEEAEKIKCWKMKMDCDVLDKDRKLQEHRITIESQRKAIQELQFENENLSNKLEEQLNETEDLRNKNNATRNLCNILKDTFERTTEKMSLFNAEREETHGLFMQNHENIQRMVTAFEALRIQAEADQQELLKVTEGLKQFEELKLRFERQYHLKEEETSSLERKLKEKENDLKELLFRLQETKQDYILLKESANQHQELLQNCKQEQDNLMEKLKRSERIRQETEDNQKVLANMFEQTKESYTKRLQEKDNTVDELSNIKEQLAQQNKEMKMRVETLQSSLAAEKQRALELEVKLSSLSEEVSKKTMELGKIKEEKKEHGLQMQTLKDEVDKKSNALKSLDEKIKEDSGKILQLSTEHETKQIEINELKMKLKDMEDQLSEALKNENTASSEIERLKKDVDNYIDTYEDLLKRFHELQLQKSTMQQQAEGGALKTKETKEMDEKMKLEVAKLEEEKQQLQTQVEVLSAKIEKQHEENEITQEQLKQSNKSVQSELIKKERHIKALELKLTNLKTKMETKTKGRDESLKENKALRKQITLEKEKCLQYEAEINKLKEESQHIKEHHEEELKKISSELENKSASEALRQEVQKLKQEAIGAVTAKEDTEIKCQQKISDMVALMEKHKHEYDKMVEEKDAELTEKRMQEAEVNASKASMELELSHLQVENGQLKQQLEKMNMEKENLQEEVLELHKMHITLRENYTEKQGSLHQEIATLKKHIKSLEKNKAQKIFTYSALTKGEIGTPSKNASATPFKTETPSWTVERNSGRTPQIRSFRVCTPPSTEKSALWRRNTLELEPNFDSSEQNDIPSFSATCSKPKMPMQENDSRKECLGFFKKVQSSTVNKSPGAALKVAAMKRIRDAGWTTITSSEKKKKKISDNIFA